MESIFLYGASGHGKVILEIAEELDLRIGGFIDDNPDLTEILGYPVIGRSAFKAENSRVVISIGVNATRKKVAEQNPGLNYISLISPRTNISPRAILEIGTVVMPGVTINTETQIGKHVIINTNSSIDHECQIGDYVHISPNVGIAGDVHIGDLTHVGIGVSIIQGIRIGKNVTIGAGAVIIRDIPDNAVVVGNPGKIIKYND